MEFCRSVPAGEARFVQPLGLRVTPVGNRRNTHETKQQKKKGNQSKRAGREHSHDPGGPHGQPESSRLGRGMSRNRVPFQNKTKKEEKT